MQCKIVYLKPRASYRPAMRSDTLWGALCWGVRLLYGEEYLVKFIEGYGQEGPEVAPLFITSAFPFIDKGPYNRILFFPPPLLGLKPYEEIPAGLSFQEARVELRERKEVEKFEWLNQRAFEYFYGDNFELPPDTEHPSLTVRPMTHNTIDRLTGSTLTANRRGQLFHTEERYVHEKKRRKEAGLYFLAKGNTGLLEEALRLLEHLGIGGDRSTGKGRFDIEMQDIELKEPSQPNGMMALSLYHPTQAELEAYEKEPENSKLQYKTLVRQGWRAARPKKPVLYFEEGSVFPVSGDGQAETPVLGRNAFAGKHEEGHDITQYGYGFMIKVKVPAYED